MKTTLIKNLASVLVGMLACTACAKRGAKVNAASVPPVQFSQTRCSQEKTIDVLGAWQRSVFHSKVSQETELRAFPAAGKLEIVPLEDLVSAQMVIQTAAVCSKQLVNGTKASGSYSVRTVGTACPITADFKVTTTTTPAAQIKDSVFNYAATAPLFVTVNDIVNASLHSVETDKAIAIHGPFSVDISTVGKLKSTSLGDVDIQQTKNATRETESSDEHTLEVLKIGLTDCSSVLRTESFGNETSTTLNGVLVN